jgi:transposase InsO family protein
LVSGPLPRHQDFRSRRKPYPQTQWRQQTSARNADTKNSHQALQQAGDRPSYSNGCKISHAGKRGQNIRRFQFTAIDDATRIRALKIYDKHTQANAIYFVNYVVGKFPFRIREIRTDNGHEFQAKFHWHVEDLGIRHTYIKRGTPQLNGKVERSHRSDQEEFYQLLSYKDDVDLDAKLNEWENFYNFNRPHGAFNGKTPYEALREKL